MSESLESVVVLIVDDDAQDSELIADRLRGAGVWNDVIAVPSGEALLAYADRADAWAPPETSPIPGFVLLDLGLPGLQGHEVLTELRRRPGWQNVPVVVLTGSADPDDGVRSLQASATAHLRKPLSLKELMRVLSRLGGYGFELVGGGISASA